VVTSLRAGRSLSFLAASALLLAACGSAPAATGSEAASATAAATPTPTEAATPIATPSASASEAAEGACLNEAIMAAYQELKSGTMDPDPSAADVADALEALELDGAAADARDDAVNALRESPLEPWTIANALNQLQATVALPEC
jgi:hypothetical protein